MPQAKYAYASALSLVLAAVTSFTCLSAQATHASYFADGDNQPSLLIHKDLETVEQDGGWDRGDALRQYADQYAGNYILAEQHGSVRRLDDGKAVAEVMAMRAPMDNLSAQQNALGAQMKPLSSQMKALGAEMRATREASKQTRLGAEMSALGKQMSVIGQQQGAIGQQQGQLGRAVHQRVLELIDACTKNNTCPVVSGPTA